MNSWRNSQGHQETFKGDEYVYYLEGDNGFIRVYMCQIIDFKYVQFIVYQLCINRAVYFKVDGSVYKFA